MTQHGGTPEPGARDAAGKLALLARQSLSGDATRRDPASFAKVDAKIAHNKRRRRTAWASATAVVALAAALAVLVTRTRSLTYQVVNGAVVEGSRIVAGPSTEVRFSDGSELALDPGTQTRIAALDARGGQVSLDDGAANVKIAKRPGAAWTLAAGPYSVRVTGTAFLLSWSKSKQAFEIAMKSGSVVVTGPLIGAGIALHAGQRLHSDVGTGRLIVDDGSAPAVAAVLAPTPSPAAATPTPTAALSPAAPAPSGPGPDASAQSHGSGLEWRKKAAQGEFGDVIAAAERRGLDTTLATAPLDDLAALADSARYARRSSLAKRTLLAERSRFPKSGAARDAAFFLGRIAEDEGGGASEWYDRYLNESPQGAYASQALGRKMMLVYQQRGAAAAQALAAEYLARYPSGAYAGTAKKIGAELGAASGG
ncbi:MAG TPA: FecR family protein [Polyangiaceae bacterium]|nr:FecR family protein [Polyangiaceae bacterium]